jgi:hypothetical protein
MNTKSETIGSITKRATSGMNEDGRFGMKFTVSVVLALWLGLVVFLGSQGAFVGKAGSPPLPLFLGFAIPLAVFFAAYFGSSIFRGFVLGADLRLLAAIQAWRWAGVGFLSLYAQGILPGLLAFPAGLGDMAIGVTAPWIVLQLVRRPSFAVSRRYVIWNVLGIVDFVVALSMGTLSSGFFGDLNGLIGGVTSSPMTHLPLALIPAFMVPFFSMLHIAALLQARQLARSGRAVSLG